MTIHLRPDLEAMLKTQVELGKFPAVEAALEAAIKALADDSRIEGDLNWARPCLDEAERAIAAGDTLSEEETYAGLEKRFGKL